MGRRVPDVRTRSRENRWGCNAPSVSLPRAIRPLRNSKAIQASVGAKASDLIINGYEAGGVRYVFTIVKLKGRFFWLLGMTPEVARDRFGFLLDALQFEHPPHGGIALGIDRLLCSSVVLDNIRDVIAFPKTQRAMDLMTEAPGMVETKQLL